MYDTEDVLQYASLDGVPMELFDERNPDGTKTGVVKERGVAHREGALHATVHIWIVRPNDLSGYDVLLQRRSKTKESNPGCYDISSAGHVNAGCDYPESALRELEEELGIKAEPGQLREVGMRRCGFEGTFYGRPFKDDELSRIYLYQEPVEIEDLTLQEEEVSEVIWMDYAECREIILDESLKEFFPHCIYAEEFDMLGKKLGILEVVEGAGKFAL